jgi:hypothetical protein
MEKAEMAEFCAAANDPSRAFPGTFVICGAKLNIFARPSAISRLPRKT